MDGCYREGGCGPYENRSCNECPASNPKYAERKTKKLPHKEALKCLQERLDISERILGDAGISPDATSLQALKQGVDALEIMPEYKKLKKLNTPKLLKDGKCPNCEQKISGRVNFCSECGQALMFKV